MLPAALDAQSRRCSTRQCRPSQRIPAKTHKQNKNLNSVLSPLSFGRVTLGSSSSYSNCARAQSGLHASTTASTAQKTIDTGFSLTNAQRELTVVIAGAGIGGLVLALALIKKGIKVTILERDLTAVRGEGKYRGPIQVQSNALAALDAIDADAALEVMQNGCITGDRVNGLCDGVSGDWYVKFDTFHPAVEKGMPVTRVISRLELQEILARHVIRLGGPDVIHGNSQVVGWEEVANTQTGMQGVRVKLSDGRTCEGDMLIGADGIWSNIRKELVGDSKAHYSGYTCYTGISDFTPADIELVAYRVFLGNGQYFVSSDVGGGKMQWYGFHEEPAGGTDVEGQRKDRLLRIFGEWCDDVTDLIKATPEEDVLRRDIFDRPPVFKWAQGRVALLGDSAHAMQPNLGQGGCMAIEDAHQLALVLEEAGMFSEGNIKALNVPAALKEYQNKRLMRVSSIHGMAGMAAFMASTYKAYLGEGLGPLSWITKFKIPHPGRVAGQVVMKLTMPTVLSWVLGGNDQTLRNCRTPSCQLGDKNAHFSDDDFYTFMGNDKELVRAMRAEWLLVPEQEAAAAWSGRTSGVAISEAPVTVGRRHEDGCQVTIEDVHVNPQHAQLFKKGKDYFVCDLGSTNGTWVNGVRIPSSVPFMLQPSDSIEFGRHPTNLPFKVKTRHLEPEAQPKVGQRVPQLAGARRGEAAGVLVAN